MFGIVIVSLLGGVVSGMGMGGGTVLIPLLTIFCSVSQIEAQGLNLVSFIPTSIVATIIHIKNKLIKFPYLFLSIPALISSILTSLLAHRVSSNFLKVGFGVFLIVLGVANIITLIIKKYYENKMKN